MKPVHDDVVVVISVPDEGFSGPGRPLGQIMVVGQMGQVMVGVAIGVTVVLLVRVRTSGDGGHCGYSLGHSEWKKIC